MTDKSPQDLTQDQAVEVLTSYVHRNLGQEAQVSGVTFREDYQVWECWVAGVEGYVKAYIVRLAPSKGDWICRHITVMDPVGMMGGREPG